MLTRRLLTIALLAAANLAVSVRDASAIPILQVYLEGATYDGDSDTWIVDDASGPLRLWTIGNVGGEGSKGTISDVRLAVAYASTSPAPVITLTPSTTGGYGGFTDPSTPSAPPLVQTVTDGSIPKLSDGKDLPSHGIYGAGTDWQEFYLGHFSLKDSPIADFMSAFPDAGLPGEGQINVYEVSAAGFSGTLHFDLYDSVQAGNKARAVFAPFSHDGEGTPGDVVPEPGTLMLLGAGAVGYIARLRKRHI